MKKITLLFTVLLFVSVTTNSIAQTCLPEGIEFNNQDEIDSFSSNYPGCTTIIGNMTVKGDDIVSLQGLSQIRYVMGLFRVTENATLENLNGLEEIVYPGQMFFISKNPELKQLFTFANTGLELGGLSIYDNAKLQNLHGMESLKSVHTLDVINNDLMENLEGLNNIESIKFQVRIQRNQNLKSFIGLESLSIVESDIMVSLNDSLESFLGLEKLVSISGSLYINGNHNIKSFLGLDSLKAVHHILQIDDNETLTDISALASLNSNLIDSIQITDNKLLNTCHIQSICDYIGIAENGIYLHDNAEGCMDRAQIDSGCQGSGIEHHFNDNVFRVYPNPASDRVTLELLDDQEITRVEIYDIQGNRAISQTGNMKEIDVSALSTGMYILKVTTKNYIARQKIFVQH
jgi:hypothetical protein